MSDLNTTFQKYAGQPVTGKEDPILENLKNDLGGKVRVIFPGQMVTQDFQPGRANVRLEERDEGGYTLPQELTFG